MPSGCARAGPRGDSTTSATGAPAPPRPPWPRESKRPPRRSRGPAPRVALRHLPHADQRVRPAPQHQLLQVPDLRPVLLPRRLEDPLPQPPYVLLMGTPVNGVPLQHVLRSVHRHRRLTCPSVPAVTSCFASKAHLPTSARFRARAPGPVSGQLYETAGEGAGHAVPLSCCLSAAGIRFLGILSRPGIPPPLTAGLPRRQRQRGPRRGFRVPHA